MHRLPAVYLIALLAVLATSIGFAARTFPEQAIRGELGAHQYPYMKIDDRTFRLAPGGKIFNEQNLIIMPDSLQAQTAPVMYFVDMNGDLSQVWLLTAEEAALYPLKKK